VPDCVDALWEPPRQSAAVSRKAAPDASLTARFLILEALGSQPRVRPSPNIYLIAGANGVGKTTFAREFLPKEVNCLRFMNADEVARGLSPFAPDAAALRAGRVLITEIQAALKSRDTFGWESTLSGRGHALLLREASDSGYEIELHYLSVPSPSVCVERVARRVREGGHHVPAMDIRRRFYRSLANLVEIYLPLADRWTIWDATRTKPVPLFDSTRSTVADVRSILPT
jgi:predicted ABC-type ATPase